MLQGEAAAGGTEREEGGREGRAVQAGAGPQASVR